MKKTPLAYPLSCLFMTVFLAACNTTPHRAPVVDLGTISGTSRASGDSGSARAADAPGYYTVKKGDTLLRIAQEFGQNFHDLVAWNQLTNANDIRVDQVLRVQPPTGAAQTGSVAAGSGVEVRPLNSSQAAAPSNIVTKTGPRGDKRAYSEAALAELQKPDTSGSSGNSSSSSSGAIAPRPDPTTTRTTEGKAAEKTADGAQPAEDNIAFIWPTEGKVVGTFDEGKKGLDVAGKSGQSVLAAAGGKVMYAGSGIRGYGNLVIVKHSNSLLSAYAHNKAILVKEGQTVTKGEKIAEMGNSDSDSVKLHFEIRQQGKPVDPSKFLPAR